MWLAIDGSKVSEEDEPKLGLKLGVGYLKVNFNKAYSRSQATVLGLALADGGDGHLGLRSGVVVECEACRFLWWFSGVGEYGGGWAFGVCSRQTMGEEDVIQFLGLHLLRCVRIAGIKIRC